MTAPRALALVALAALALAVAGCGGSGGGGKPQKQALTRAQLAARIDSICRNAKARAAKVAKPTDLVSYARAARTLLNIATRVRRDVEALDPSDADRAAVSAYAASLDAPIRELRSVRTAAYKEKRSETARGVGRYRQLARQADRRAAELGATAC
jgi:hypothetical protein